MSGKSQYKAEKFWDRTASSYDSEEKKDEKIYLQIIEHTRKYLKPSTTLLDFGCGTGIITNELARNVSNIDGIDLSSKMIEIARSKAEKAGIQNIKYAHTTILDPNLKPTSYDVIVCFYVLHLLDDAQEAMQKIHSLLKPEGILISVTPCMAEKPIQGFLFSLLSKIGILPKLNLLKRRDLEQLSEAHFSTIESERLPNTSNQYFLVSKK